MRHAFTPISISLQGGSDIISYLLTHCYSSVAAVSKIWDLPHLMSSPSTIQSHFRLQKGKYTEVFFSQWLLKRYIYMLSLLSWKNKSDFKFPNDKESIPICILFFVSQKCWTSLLHWEHKLVVLQYFFSHLRASVMQATSINRLFSHMGQII